MVDDFRYILRPYKEESLKGEYAYLMPPSMRTVARYMNLTSWLEWAYRIIDIGYNRLNKKEKTAYSFLMSYADLISELHHNDA